MQTHAKPLVCCCTLRVAGGGYWFVNIIQQLDSIAVKYTESARSTSVQQQKQALIMSDNSGRLGDL